VAAASFAGLDQVDRVYTDTGAPPDMARAMEGHGVQVEMVSGSKTVE
jgi:hypothetical protein